MQGSIIQRVKDAFRVSLGQRLPLYRPGFNSPSLFSSEDRNHEVQTINALSNPSLRPDWAGDFSLSDSNAVLDIQPLIDWLNQQLGNQSPGSSGAQAMQVRAIYPAYYVCRTVDMPTATIGTTDILVAKPIELQNPGAGNSQTEIVEGITWTYTYAARTNNSDMQRTASASGQLSEVHIIEPIYHINAFSDGYSVIYADQPVGGAGVTVSGTPLVWMDTNRDGRAWTQVG